MLILEDDIRFVEGFGHAAPPALNELATRDWGIFQFGAIRAALRADRLADLFRYWRGHAAHAVALHARTYDFLIGDYICELDRGNWDQRISAVRRIRQQSAGLLLPGLRIAQAPGVAASGRSDTRGHEVDYRSLIEQSYEHLPAA